MREQLVREVEIIPLEVVVRNVAAGSLAKRLGLEEGTALPRSIIEFYYKNDELGDPDGVGRTHHRLRLGGAQEIDDIMHMSIRINDFLTGLFLGIGIKLVDFKIEFGRLYRERHDAHRAGRRNQRPTPAGCGISKTNDKLDKDRFRRDWAAWSEPIRKWPSALASSQPTKARTLEAQTGEER